MILLCYDGSASSKHMVTAAHEILGDAKVTVLHVWQPPASYLVGDSYSYLGVAKVEPEQVNNLDAILRERAGHLVAEGVSIAKEAGFDAESRLEESNGSPWRTILEAAATIDASLIVVGAHEVGAIEAALLGSVSTAIVHHAKRPVLVVPEISG